jgi:rhodanese-related sulfurtransferase
MAAVQQITPLDLDRMLRQSDPPLILDVRRADEFATASIEGALNIALDDLPYSLDEVPKGRAIVTLCHHGVRSARAAQFLQEQGYTQVSSLEGGIDAWALQVDKTVPRY